MAKKINRGNILEHLIEKQFNYIEKTILNVMFEPKWKEDWTLSKEQYEKWQRYAIPLLKKTFKCNTGKAKTNFEWIVEKYGLKIK